MLKIFLFILLFIYLIGTIVSFFICEFIMHATKAKRVSFNNEIMVVLASWYSVKFFFGKMFTFDSARYEACTDWKGEVMKYRRYSYIAEPFKEYFAKFVERR